ncbi:MAG: alanine racemase [Phycisphaerae bacterium]|nr:alanine racemase [Phycisphaerae bacterium]
MKPRAKQGVLSGRHRQQDNSAIARMYEIGPLRPGNISLKTVKAYVSRNNLRHNARQFKQLLGPTTKLCAVVKANGYGLSAGSVVSALNDNYTDCFAVSTIEEAEQIHPFVFGKTILVTCPLFAGIDLPLIRLAQARGLHCSISSIESLRYVMANLDPELEPLNIHAKIDTGMGRLGALPADAMALIQSADKHQLFKLVGIYTHFATADQQDMQYLNQQHDQFIDMLNLTGLNNHPNGQRRIKSSVNHSPLINPGQVIRHACNTAATLQFPAAHYDMVRCGLGLYGYANKALYQNINLDLRPVLKVQAPLVQVKTIAPGQSCGYGRTFTAKKQMTVGVVPVGYADGLPRSISNKASMCVGAIPAPIIGQISMDLTIIDLSKVPNPHEGMTVTVIDDDLQSCCNVNQLAKHANTIPYEILTSIGNRIKRVFV